MEINYHQGDADELASHSQVTESHSAHGSELSLTANAQNDIQIGQRKPNGHCLCQQSLCVPLLLIIELYFSDKHLFLT